MGSRSASAPQPWPSPPSTITASSFYKDCSQQICNIYCPEWCPLLFPPPPSDSSSSRVSPLMIALISALAAAFVLLCYYTFHSKLFRGRRRYSQNAAAHTEDDPDLEAQGLAARADQMVQRASGGAGLDEAFIREITVFKYKRGDGLVESTDCAVCLNEFKEEESLRLMPNCEHAFHIPCIDTWLKSHSSCPLCRAALHRPAPGSVQVSALRVERRNGTVLVVREVDSGVEGEVIVRRHELPVGSAASNGGGGDCREFEGGDGDTEARKGQSNQRKEGQDRN